MSKYSTNISKGFLQKRLSGLDGSTEDRRTIRGRRESREEEKRREQRGGERAERRERRREKREERGGELWTHSNQAHSYGG